MADVDNSAWDGSAAMNSCSTASDYRSICAGRRAGDPTLRITWALPHHRRPGAPPNAAGVRNALARLPQTQGLVNRQAAQSHLESHMSAISPESSDHHGGYEVRTADVGGWEVRHSGTPGQSFTVRGYAAVFNQLSHDLGGFRERIDPGAFDEVLSTSPDVHFVWDHDTRYVGARTRNGTLELRTDNTGLWMEAKVGQYSWAKDLMTALQRGDIDQGSFKFSVSDGGDSWDAQDDGSVVRTLNAVGGLYDVTVTAQGAYPQTSLAATRSLEALLVTPGEGEPSSLEQGDVIPDVSERDPRVEALEARLVLHRQEIAEAAERLRRL